MFTISVSGEPFKERRFGNSSWSMVTLVGSNWKLLRCPPKSLRIRLLEGGKQRFPFERFINGTSFLAAFRSILIYIYAVSILMWYVKMPLSSLCTLRDMIENSREWARNRGLLQTNPVHGREEWKTPISRDFSFTNKTSQSTKSSGSMVVQDSAKLECLSFFYLNVGSGIS